MCFYRTHDLVTQANPWSFPFFQFTFTIIHSTHLSNRIGALSHCNCAEKRQKGSSIDGCEIFIDAGCKKKKHQGRLKCHLTA